MEEKKALRKLVRREKQWERDDGSAVQPKGTKLTRGPIFHWRDISVCAGGLVKQ